MTGSTENAVPEFSGPATEQISELMVAYTRDLLALRERMDVEVPDVLRVTTERLWEGVRVVAGHIDLLRLSVDALVNNAADGEVDRPS